MLLQIKINGKFIALHPENIYDHYVERFGFCNPETAGPFNENLILVVVIPAYKEPKLWDSVKSILNSASMSKFESQIELIVVFNSSESDKEAKTYNQNTVTDLRQSLKDFNSDIPIHIMCKDDLPPKHAGVGLARKIGMDEACFRLNRSKEETRIISCFDADSLCKENYVKELVTHFQKNQSAGCSIHFEHPVSGDEFEDWNYQAIVEYELHLRCYKNGLKYAGFPFAFHTIGSSMAVEFYNYMQQGGMNKRKAGEDFYFLNKIIQTGKFTELNSTCVYPSPRVSSRVPFGTGKAMGKLSDDLNKTILTYDIQTYITLHKFNSLVKSNGNKTKHSDLPSSFKSFVSEKTWNSKIQEINIHSSSPASFLKRFYQWIDPFMVLKFTHYYRDHITDETSVENCAIELLKAMGINENFKSYNSLELLIIFRKLDQNEI